MTVRLLGLFFALGLSTALLNLPMDVTALRYPWFWAPPLELLLVAAVAFALGPPRAQMTGWLAVVILLPLMLQALLEALVFGLFGRPLRLATDLSLWPVLADAVRLEVLPPPLLALGMGLLLLVPLLLGWRLWHLAAGLAALFGRPHRAAAALLLIAGLGAWSIQHLLGSSWQHYRLVSTDGIGRLLLQLRAHQQLQHELARLQHAIATDPLAHEPPSLARLAGVDVALVFIESYGQVALNRPPFAAPLQAELRAWGERLEAAGLHLASGLLASPTIGGQSWLAHATVRTGLRIDHEAAWHLLLTQPRTTLIDLFRRTGHHTWLVMPAITRPFPESRRFGFDHVLFAADLGYAGPPFGFAAAPDQFTLAVVARQLFTQPAALRAPVFAEIVLTTSHAPFTPVPDLLPWEEIGDGQSFARFVADAQSPSAIWSSPEQVRTAYARALRYSLAAAFAFAAHVADRCLLVLILGDHPPAMAIGGEADRAVPVHIATGAPELLDPLLRHTGWVRGMVPDAAAAPLGMEEVRDLFVRAFGSGPAPCAQTAAAALKREPGRRM